MAIVGGRGLSPIARAHAQAAAKAEATRWKLVQKEIASRPTEEIDALVALLKYVVEHPMPDASNIHMGVQLLPQLPENQQVFGELIHLPPEVLLAALTAWRAGDDFEGFSARP